MNKLFFLLAILAAPVNAQQITLNKEMHSMTVSIESGELDYMCLSSAEYGQLYLPEEFACHDCSVSEDSKELLNEAWGPDHILLITRSNNVLDVKRLDFSAASNMDMYTSYRNISYFPEKVNKMSQCTYAAVAVAGCHEQSGSCLMLFNREH